MRCVSHGCSLHPVRQKWDIREMKQRDLSSGQGFPLSQAHKFAHVIAPRGHSIQGFEHLPAEWHSIRRIFSPPQDESSHLTCPSLPSEPHQSCCSQVGAVDHTDIDFANFPKPVFKSLWNPFLGLELNYMQIKKKGFNYTWCSSCLHIQNRKKASLVICRNLQRDSGEICNDPSTVRYKIRALTKGLNKVLKCSVLETAEVKWTRCKT